MLPSTRTAERRPKLSARPERRRPIDGPNQNGGALYGGAAVGQEKVPTTLKMRQPLSTLSPRRRRTIEPALKHHRSGHAIDEPLLPATLHPTLSQPPRSFHRRPSFVEQFHRHPRHRMNLTRKRLHLRRHRPGHPGHVERQSNDEQPNPFLANQLRQCRQEPSFVSAIERRANVCKQPQFIGHRNTDPSFSQVESAGTWMLRTVLHARHLEGEPGQTSSPSVLP